MKQLRTLGIIGGAALSIAAPFSLQWSQKNALLSLDGAEARTGRPLTATRMAGVSRRVPRRAYRAVQFSERWCSATFRAIPSTLERIDTAPHISLPLPLAATTYHL